MTNETLTAKDIIAVATDCANARINAYKEQMTENEKNSNGSEAWQAVIFETKGLRKLQNELKKAGVDKDGYWGYTLTAPMSNYYMEREWLVEFVRVLKDMGIKARITERLL